MDTQLRLGVLYVGTQAFSATKGCKFLNTLVFKDCMRAPKLPVAYVNIISQTGGGWQGPPEVIWPTPPARARAGCPGPRPDGF